MPLAGALANLRARIRSDAASMSGKALKRRLREAAGDDDCDGIDAALHLARDFEGTLNSRDFVGATALHWAARRGRARAVGHLLRLGAKVCLSDAQQSPLLVLAECGSEDAYAIVPALVAAAPWQLVHTDSMGNTPLDRARYCGNKRMVSALKEAHGAAGEGFDAPPPKKRGYFARLFFGHPQLEDDAEFSLLSPGLGEPVGA